MKPQITKYENGNIQFIEYFNDNDEYHRTDGPAFQSFYENGNIQCESWYKNGNIEYDAWYYVNGNVKYVTWHFNGILHKIDGPAKIRYYENGNIAYEYYYINGKQLSKQEFIIHNRKRKLKIINETTNN
jgi:antitoxin component YwqK of YwqJK toxin-antitoxin module